MVLFNCSPIDRTAEIVLRPNPAWPWRANVRFIAVMAVISVVIAVAAVTVGLWAVPFFSVLELALLSWALYRISRQAKRQEVLRFCGEELVLEAGYERPNRRFTFNRPWTRFEVQPPRQRGYRPRVQVCSRGEALEIGSFLSADDQNRLIEALREVIRILDRGGAATSADSRA